MLSNRAKQRITSGQVALGVSCGLGAPFLAEVLARAGFDWVMIDNQHGMWDRQSTSLAMMGVRAGGSTPMVRAPENDYYAIGRLLDEGALGVIVPMVEKPRGGGAGGPGLPLSARRRPLGRCERRERVRPQLSRAGQRRDSRGDPA